MYVTHLAANGYGVIGDGEKLGIRLDVLGMVLTIDLGGCLEDVRGLGRSLLLRIGRGIFVGSVLVLLRISSSSRGYLLRGFWLRSSLRIRSGGYRGGSLSRHRLGFFLAHDVRR